MGFLGKTLGWMLISWVSLMTLGGLVSELLK